MEPSVPVRVRKAWALTASLLSTTSMAYLTLAGVYTAKDRACSVKAAYIQPTLGARKMAAAFAVNITAENFSRAEQRNFRVSRSNRTMAGISSSAI